MSVQVQKIHNAPAFEHRRYKHDVNAPDKQVHVHDKEFPNSEAQRPSISPWSIPPSAWQPLRHPRCEHVSREVNAYFISEWNFPSEKAEKRFLAADFPGVTCLYFPLAKDDRIHFACTLLTVLFLIDDILEDMSFEDGEAYNEKLIPIVRGDVLPDRRDPHFGFPRDADVNIGSNPAEYILYDLWESMRYYDKALADEVLDPTFTFMRAQTDRVRLHITELGQYLEYREKDVGKALLSALMRFSMGIRLTERELAGMTALEQNCSKQISVVNDIYSWEKELQASKTAHREGATLCSAVKVLADSTTLDIEASKRVLWAMVREWEHVHDYLCKFKSPSPEGCSEAERVYMTGLEYQMSGNELWSKTTKRYSVID